MATNQRIQWIDIFKGLAICCVVLGHSGSPITATIYLFHMPAFFFISGYTTNLEKYAVVDFTIRRIRSLVIPFIGINLFLVMLWVLSAGVGLNQKFFSQLVNADSLVNFLRAIVFRLQPAMEIGGATWFAIALFSAAVSCKLWQSVIKYFGGADWLLLLATSLVATSMTIGAKEKIILPYELDLGLLGSLFFAAGYLANKSKFLTNGIRPWLGAALAFGGLWYFTKYDWIKINFPGRDFASLYEMCASAACGIYAVYLCARVADRIPLLRDTLSYAGKNSFAILALHFLGFKFAYLIIIFTGIVPASDLLNLVPLRAANSYWYLFAFLGVFLPLLAAWFTSRSPLLSYLLFAQDSDQAKAQTKTLFGARPSDA